MTAALAFVVPGNPVTWKRAQRGNGHSYTHPKAAAHMELVRAAARNAGIRAPILGPVVLRCEFYKAGIDPTDVRFGDRDNLEKLVKDALNGIAWPDDRFVVDGGSVKARDDANPRTVVEIRALDVQEAKRGFRSILGPKATAKLNRGRMVSSVRRYGA